MGNEEIVFHNHTVEISGVRTNVYIGGEGRPLLWFHGGGGLTLGVSIHQALAREYQVYLVEHPGFGLSERPKWLLDFTDYNYFYRDFLTYFSLEKVHLVGHSFGGRVAVEFAVSHPHRVDKLVLICAAGLQVPDEKRANLFVMSPEEANQLLFYDAGWTKRFFARERTAEERLVDANNVTTRAILNWRRDYNPRFPRLLKYVEAPTCIVWGKEDEVVGVKHGQVYHEHIRHSVLHVLEECGHMPFIEKEEACNEIVMKFLLNGEQQ